MIGESKFLVDLNIGRALSITRNCRRGAAATKKQQQQPGCSTAVHREIERIEALEKEEAEQEQLRQRRQAEEEQRRQKQRREQQKAEEEADHAASAASASKIQARHRGNQDRQVVISIKQDIANEVVS